jgi:hypothetical protein
MNSKNTAGRSPIGLVKICSSEHPLDGHRYLPFSAVNGVLGKEELVWAVDENRVLVCLGRRPFG